MLRSLRVKAQSLGHWGTEKALCLDTPGTNCLQSGYKTMTQHNPRGKAALWRNSEFVRVD